MLIGSRILSYLAAPAVGQTSLVALTHKVQLLGASAGICTTSSTQAVSAPSTNAKPNGVPYVPWTPSSQLQKRKEYKKRMKYLVQELEKENMQNMQELRSYPPFRSGDILEIRMLVPENQRKEYILKGLCIARHNKSFRTAFTLYNVFPDVGGVVQHFPLYMPDILEIKVVGKVKTNKSKMYHMKNKETLNHSYQSEVQVAS